MTPVTRGLPDVITAQTLFDKVATHLIIQGRPAVNSSLCRYRTGQDGELSCAAGILITDDRYQSWMENKRIGADVMVDALPELRPHIPLLNALQELHDDQGYWVGRPGNYEFDKDALVRRLAGIAKAKELTMPEIAAEPATA